MAEVKVFVGRLPRDITDEDFEALMASQTGIVKTVLLKDRATGKCKGCGFVLFSTLAEAVACVEALNGAVTVSERLGPLQVSVATGEAEKHGVPQQAVDPGEAKLFVGGLPKGAERSVVEAEVEAIFSGYGQVNQVFIMKDKANMCNGAGFVKMASTAAAVTAIEALHDQHAVAGGTSALEVRFAVARRDQQPASEYPAYPAYPLYADGAGKGGFKGAAQGFYMGGVLPMAPVSVATGEAGQYGVPQRAVDPGEAKLFVGGLPKGEDRSVVAAEVEAIFSGYGKVREVFIMKDKANKCNGAGFVFMPTASAMTAIEALHEQHIMAGGTSAIEVRFAVARRDQQPTPEEYPAYPAYAKGAGKGGIKGGAKGAYMGGMPPMAPMRFPAPAMHMMQQRAAKGGGRAPPPPPDDGLRAIAGWTEFLGGNGRPYYYHAATGLTQWQQPIEFKSLPALGMGTPFATKGGKKGGRARPY